MYSLLLMSAMAGTPDATSFGWRSAACHGCYATVPVGCTGCSGSASCQGTTSCYGTSSCTGCTGASRGPLFPRLAARHASKSAGCQGSCYGSGYGNCAGGSTCYGHIPYGSCYGSMRGAACMGNCYGSFYGLGCYGSCYGQAACYGHVAGPMMAIDPIPHVTVAATKAPTTLTVELPANATLFVDGGLVKGQGALRTFNTPELAIGQSFYYELKAEVVINGKTEVEEQRVIVRAGEPAKATFSKLTAAVTTAGAAVASK